MKVLDYLTIHTPPSSLVVSFHLRDLYRYYRPCIEDPKKHYGFKLDYALCEVIINDDSHVPDPPAVAIPDEHLLKFHSIKDAKSLWEAIKTRFGGNKESKKMHKTILKQQYKNFVSSRSEGLDKTYDRDGSQMVGGHDYNEGKRFIKKTGRNLNFNGKEPVVLIRQELDVTFATEEGILLENVVHQGIR
nr:ribonuclease H-like domain-containing protein [Tanacetum cinerariifolium]